MPSGFMPVVTDLRPKQFRISLWVKRSIMHMALGKCVEKNVPTDILSVEDSTDWKSVVRYFHFERLP